MWLEVALFVLSAVLGIMYIAYFWFGTDRIEEEIGVGYTKKHMRLWFFIALIEFLMLWAVFMFGV